MAVQPAGRWQPLQRLLRRRTLHVAMMALKRVPLFQQRCHINTRALDTRRRAGLRQGRGRRRFRVGSLRRPHSNFDHLEWRAIRAARPVADTGIRASGGSHPQVGDFMLERTEVQRESVSGEFDRPISHPGQALACTIGKLRSDELRDRAKARLDGQFDIRQLHWTELGHGAYRRWVR